jgi:predicted ATPase/class 3 adenylate cyclase
MTTESGSPLGPRSALPTGTVTFLFTDIEGSTRLLQELGEDYREVQDQHAEIMRKAIADGDGVEVRTEGDSFFFVFLTPVSAVRAAATAQRALSAHDWGQGGPLRVRMGMHTGEGIRGGGDYVGIDVNRAARIAASGHGGQVLMSEATRALVEHSLPAGVQLRDLGEHRLKDIPHPERLFDLAIEGVPSDFPAPRTADVRWNVPAERTRFIGREREAAAVVGLLASSRLITLTGTGGSGKTRLSMRIAALVREHFRHGVVFVDLAPLTDPALVPSAIAAAAGVHEQAGVPIEETLEGSLADREVLLILDNFEHLKEAAQIVSRLLNAAPTLRILVTSRVSLHLMGEQEFPVPPMTVPSPDSPLDRLREAEAVALFLERARAVDPSLPLGEDDLRAIAELCVRLDGLPLAIELAASRVRALSPTAILERLGAELHRLAGGPRDAPARHRTLAEAIRWTDGLLEEAASAMLHRLAVFAGGWTLEAAAAVANPDAELGADTLGLMEELVDHGLIRKEGEGFRMLETVRGYAAEQLGEKAELIQRRHARFFLDLVEIAEPRITNPLEHDTLAELERENDNLRAALRWCVGHDLATGMRIGAAVWRFWHLRGHLAEGRVAMEQLLGAPGADAAELGVERARGLVAHAAVAYWQNDYATARASYEEAIDIARRLQADAPLGDAIYGLAFVTMIEGDVQGAAALHQEARPVLERLGDARRLATWMMSQAMILTHQREFAAAGQFLEEALPRFLELGDLWGAATSCGAMGSVHFELGNLGGAADRYLQSIRYDEQIGDDTGIAVALQGLATIAGRLGDHETALLLFAAGDRLTDVKGGKAPAALLGFDHPRPAAEAVLGAEETNRIWHRGLALGREAAVALAREKLEKAATTS